VNGRRKAWVVTAITGAYALVLFSATHFPDVQIPAIAPSGVPSDKPWHFAGYAVLAFLVNLANASWGPRRLPFVVTFAALVAIAGIDELTQPLTRRDADWVDWYADVAGIVFGATIGVFVASRSTQGPD